jgi:hypothetical protein
LNFLAGITGSTIQIDRNGDSEGNFSVLALKEAYFTMKDSNFSCKQHMVQVATFYQGSTNSVFPVSEFAHVYSFNTFCFCSFSHSLLNRREVSINCEGFGGFN